VVKPFLQSVHKKLLLHTLHNHHHLYFKNHFKNNLIESQLFPLKSIHQTLMKDQKSTGLHLQAKIISLFKIKAHISFPIFLWHNLLPCQQESYINRHHHPQNSIHLRIVSLRQRPMNTK
jgi:hypothetical protein